MRQTLLAVILSAALTDAHTAWNVGQGVKTTSGTVIGKASSWKKEVSEYLGVPFGQPASGNLRWAPPQAITNDAKTINATKFVSWGLSLECYTFADIERRERKLSLHTPRFANF
jgi:hypothetical protein